ncbi:D/L-lactic acid transporter LarD [Olsenella porci]|uniref:Aquaporin family protein n=1 Tax=Olsenella porci TaxID=2652279 RepID=A0A6N7XB27_9ACTN|nr:D/L-lactic acid transporter LarD [Olsenella porci]MST72770.1 aquaporin family protein [Olsenella porci]
MFKPIMAEFLSTALMIVFGVGVHCDTVLNGTKYHGSGHLFAITTWAFGISVCLFVFGGGVCMNPAMALAQCMLGLVPWSMFVPYAIAEMLGGLAGAVVAWLIYADAFEVSAGKVDGVAVRNIFSTNPLINDLPRSFFIEAIDTFVFVSGILSIAHFGGDNLLLVAVCVGILVWAVGMGMGGMTGFAMNQARDLGPRMAYQLLPIKGKVDNNWRYGLLVPGIAPFVGAACAALFVHGFLGIF